MPAPSRLRDFKPRFMAQAVAVVRRQHPHTADAFATPGEDVVSGVRAALRLANDEPAIRALAQRFEPLQLRATVRVAASDAVLVVRQRAGAVLSYRPRRDLLRDAWRLLIGYSPAPELESFLRLGGRAFGWKDLADTTYLQERFHAWFGADALTAGVANDSIALGVSDVDAWLATVSIPSHSPLATEVWRHLLVFCPASQFPRFSVATVVARADASPSDVRMGFAKNYLEGLAHREKWAEPVLVWILRVCGEPGSGGAQTAFWRTISASVRDQFRLWVQEKTLHDFFQRHGDTSGRFAFWRRYARFWKDVHTALDDRVMVMDFEGVGVVEFAEVGNAGYVYRQNAFRSVLSDNPRTLSEYKNKDLAVGRVFHFPNWEVRAAALVEPLIARREPGAR
jgi:hypothetical protein